MDTILDLAKRRITIRSFRRDEIDISDVYYALNVAREAPSGANKQPWRFIIVRDQSLKKRIRKHCEEVEKEFHSKAPEWLREWFREIGITWRKPFLENAPILLLVFSDGTAPYNVQSTWLAIGYILLALEERGLATVTYTPSKVRWFNELFKIDKRYVLQTILPIGKAACDICSKQPRLPLDNLILGVY